MCHSSSDHRADTCTQRKRERREKGRGEEGETVREKFDIIA